LKAKGHNPALAELTGTLQIDGRQAERLLQTMLAQNYVQILSGALELTPGRACGSGSTPPGKGSFHRPRLWPSSSGVPTSLNGCKGAAAWPERIDSIRQFALVRAPAAH
jgi:hypothetical protein